MALNAPRGDPATLGSLVAATLDRPVAPRFESTGRTARPQNRRHAGNRLQYRAARFRPGAAATSARV